AVAAGTAIVARSGHGAVALASGQVVVSGGVAPNGRQPGETTEIIDPGTSGTSAPYLVGGPNLADGHVGLPYAAYLEIAGGAGAAYAVVLPTPSQMPPGVFLGLRTWLDANANNVPECNLNNLGANGECGPVNNAAGPCLNCRYILAFSGTPALAGTFNVGVRLSDSALHTRDVTLRIRVDGIDILTTTLPDAHVGLNYNVQLQAVQGVPGQLTWATVPSFVGQLPAGITLSSSGVLSGVTNAPTSFYSFVVKVTDPIGQTAYRELGFSLNSPVAITTTSLRDGIFNNGYFGCIQTSGQTYGNRTWSIINAPVPVAGGIIINSGPNNN